MAYNVWRLNGFTVQSDGSVTSDGGFTGALIVAADETVTISGALTVAATGSVTLSTETVIADELPTSDPSVAGQWWNNSGVLNVSTG